MKVCDIVILIRGGRKTLTPRVLAVPLTDIEVWRAPDGDVHATYHPPLSRRRSWWRRWRDFWNAADISNSVAVWETTNYRELEIGA